MMPELRSNGCAGSAGKTDDTTSCPAWRAPIPPTAAIPLAVELPAEACLLLRWTAEHRCVSPTTAALPYCCFALLVLTERSLLLPINIMVMLGLACCRASSSQLAKWLNVSRLQACA